jgi:hypothetical protein
MSINCQTERANARGPKGEKRPADVIGNAVRVMRIAISEIDESTPPDDGKDPAAVALGRKGAGRRHVRQAAERYSEKGGRQTMVKKIVA